MEKTQSDKLIGMVLAERFQIQRLIGQGGMARVYLGMDQVHSVPVAVKVLKDEFLEDREFVQRFDVEARAASSLNHPNIVKVYGVGEEDGIRFMIMQYVEGVSLKELIEQYGRLDWQVAVPLAIQISQALEHAHSNGIIHRDIKPHNILVTRDHRALVTDFGIARATTPNTITVAGGATVGSVHYFSPEQARGAVVGEKTDLYSLGILLYEMLTGQVPFDADTDVAVALMQLQEEPVPPIELEPSIPQGLSRIVLKCMRKNAAERYEDARSLTWELEQFLRDPEGEYGVLPEVSQSQTSIYKAPLIQAHGDGFSKVLEMERQIEYTRRRRQRESWITLLVVLLILALVAGGIFFAIRGLSKNMDLATQEDQGTPIGNYVNRPYSEVSTELQGLKIPFQTRQEFSDEIAKDHVIEQNMSEGSRIKKMNLNPLILTISKGTDEFVLEDYVGKTVTEVENVLRAELKLNVQLELLADDKMEADRILRTDPPAGSKLRPGYSIKLFVSTGPKRVAVPSLLGLSQKEAESVIKQNGFKLGSVDDSASKAQVVVRQVPEPGAQSPLGAEIQIVLGPKPKETEEEKPRTSQSSSEQTKPTKRIGVGFP